ncbi:heterokaryon incompatibility protein-domain-containing protein, partial [Paraphoma chrysanthemicola]
IAGIPLVELPKTFRDAVEITRAIGLRYLWVDSLCIVQDSKTDWATHVEAMASIYETAHITLAAGASGDDDGGFFAVPPENYTKPSLLELDTGLQTYKLYIRRSVDHHDADWPAGELTYPNDKLPALAGLATAFERKFSPGSYLEGLWTSSLEQDFRWASSSSAAPFGRPRSGPSWSWVYSSDVRIDWPRLQDNNYCRLQEIAKSGLEYGGQGAASLTMSGILLAVSINTWKKRAEFEQHYPLTRYCRVLEHVKGESTSFGVSFKGPTRSNSPLQGSHDDAQVEEDSELGAASPSLFLSGHFNADYNFWNDEEELRAELGLVTFAALGIEDIRRHMGESIDDEEDCWVAGVILRPVMEKTCGTSKVRSYERFGWLRYCTKKPRNKFTPMGTKTNFMLV